MARSGGIGDPEDGGMRKFPDNVVVGGNSQNVFISAYGGDGGLSVVFRDTQEHRLEFARVIKRLHYAQGILNRQTKDRFTALSIIFPGPNKLV